MRFGYVQLAIAIACTAACHPQKVHKPGDEWLQSIKFEGNHGISNDDLLTGLALHRTLQAQRAPDPYQVQLDTDRLKGQYMRAGYFEADVQARIDHEQDATTITYVIQEGARSLTKVDITGLPSDPAIDVVLLRKKLPLPDGAPFDYDVYDLAKVNLLGLVQDAGYAHAKLDATVTADLPTHTAHVLLAFTPGPKCTFGNVEVTGVTGDLRDAILARLMFKRGDIYSNAAVTATQRNIYGMNRFSTVQVQPDKGDGAVVDMKVAVSESAAHQITLGGGFGIDPITEEVRGRAGYTVTGWPAPLDTFIVDLRPAYAYLRDGSGWEPRVRALVRLERQDLFMTYAVGSIELGYDYLNYEAFTNYGPRAQLGYEMRLGSPKVKLRLGYLIERYDFRDPSPLLDTALIDEIHIQSAELVSGFTQAITVDLRDNPVEPRFGLYAEIKATEGLPLANDSYTFQEIVPELRGYVPAGPFVLAARARYGAIYGDVPPTERFYAGGATSNRGFAERELSPSVTGVVSGSTLTVPYGGAGMIDSSFEARFSIAKIKTMPLGGLVFLDGGDVTLTPGALSLTNLYWAAGLGVRLLTVIGPVRADIGFRLNRTGPEDAAPDSDYAFHLSLGEAF